MNEACQDCERDESKEDEMEDVNMCAGDVDVVPMDRTECDRCDATATHYVMLDMRNNGVRRSVAECCFTCAHQFAADLRRSLPPLECTHSDCGLDGASCGHPRTG